MASAEERPLGKLIPSVPLGVEIPPESPDVGARGLYVAGRLLAGASTFFFLAFVFAYFYLRSLNEDGLWRPATNPAHHHIKPVQGLGAALIACVLISAVLAFIAGRRMKRQSSSWLAPAIGSLVLGLAAVGLQCIEFTSQKFGPTDGGYASVFCAWSAFYVIAVLGTMYWLETQIATELRARRAPAHSHGDIADPDRLIAPALDACVFFWAYLAGLGVVAYVTLYIL
jgi:heme/copper-type cytochrome/quinol oxidase subunit 3